MKGLLLAAALLTACGAAPAPAQQHVTVFAAASLTEAFDALKADATFNYAGSPTLVQQLAGGAQADVLATADETNMRKAVSAGLLKGTSRSFATNRLQIVVQAGNPKHIAGLSDLARSGLLVVLCADNVPCGSYANQALAKAAVTGVRPVSLETDVKSVVSKVALGEADAGIVYATDVEAGGAKVSGVNIPDADNIVASYPIASVSGSAAAQAFIDLVVGARGQAVLRRYGFGPP